MFLQVYTHGFRTNEIRNTDPFETALVIGQDLFRMQDRLELLLDHGWISTWLK